MILAIHIDSTPEIGEQRLCPIYFYDSDSNPIVKGDKYPIKVIREVTFEDWVRDAATICGPPPEGLKKPRDFRFFEVEVLD